MKAIIGAIAIALLVGAAHAGPFEDGADAYDRGDYASAIRFWSPLGARGDADAQAQLGCMYKKGEGTPVNYVTAVTLFRLAAAQGDAVAQAGLGSMYYSGEGVPVNYAEAAKLYRLAADQGSTMAQIGLGVIYVSGQGVPVDFVEAYKWLTLATEDDLPGATGDQVAGLCDLVKSCMTREQLVEARKRAQEWRPRVKS